MDIVVVSGGFDPVHSGHLALFEQAARLGDQLVVALNSDIWLARKKGQAFMPWQERAAILENLCMVDAVIAFDDSNDSARDALEKAKILYPNDNIIFANGGDRTDQNIPERSVAGVSFKFGIGGTEKLNSSSWLLQQWQSPRISRPWGYYRVLQDFPGTKVKELVVEPGASLSMQRHKQRAEHWFVTDGSCAFENETGVIAHLHSHDRVIIPEKYWHRLYNPYDQPCHIIEIQYGTVCAETDIERR